MTVRPEPPARDGTTPRVVRAAELAGFTAAQLLDVATAVMAILALPQSAADQVEALVVPTGQGERPRDVPDRELRMIHSGSLKSGCPGV